MTATNKKMQSNKMKTKAGNKPEKSLDDLFLHALKDMYYAEKKIHKALPKMIKAAQAPELVEALTNHRSETEQQIAGLEDIFGMLGKPAKGEPCAAINGILEEAESILEDFGHTRVCDAAIIFSCQAVEHYEITRYGSMHAFAQVLGHEDAARILETILDQEKNADTSLTDMAESRVNYASSEMDEAAGDVEEDESQSRAA